MLGHTSSHAWPYQQPCPAQHPIPGHQLYACTLPHSRINRQEKTKQREKKLGGTNTGTRVKTRGERREKFWQWGTVTRGEKTKILGKNKRVFREEDEQKEKNTERRTGENLHKPSWLTHTRNNNHHLYQFRCPSLSLPCRSLSLSPGSTTPLSL